MRNNQKGSTMMGFAIIGILGFMFYIACFSDLAKKMQEDRADKVYYKTDQQIAAEYLASHPKPKKKSSVR